MMFRKALRLNQPRSVRFRTTAGAVLALVVLLAISGVAVNWFVARSVQQSFDRTLLGQATDRAALFEAGSPLDQLITPVGDEEIVAAIDADGTVLASSGLEVATSVIALPTGVSTVQVPKFEPGEPAESETLRAAVAETSDGVRFVVANEGEETRKALTGVRNILLGVVPLTAIAAAGVAWLVTGRALQPVKAMRTELGEVVHATDGRRVTEPGTGDEIDQLSTSINAVLDRLDEQSLAQRRFVADASHELKSPLANARALIDTADPQPDRAEFERVTLSVGAELTRLTGLVDDLLYLAQADEGAPRSPERIDLADLIFDEAERVAFTSSKSIDASRVVPVEVLVDPREASRAIRNLVENAERFARSRVSIGVEVDADMARVTVADDGPGVAPEDRERVFDRFSRIDSDRARSAGGTGLGLSIVASIAARNGGAVELSEANGGGARFVLSFPRPQ